MEAKKDAYYFSHDANARHDPNISEMRADYGSEGYGWYWIIIEMMREQADYKLKLCKCNAFAMQMQCENDAAKKFIDDCLKRYELFTTDGEYFWSESLIRRMKMREEKSEKARQAALSRWENNDDANAMQTQCERNAIKGKEIKINKKDNAGKFTPPTVTEVSSYCKERNNDVDAERFCDFYQSKNWMVGKNKMKDWRAAVRTWEKKDEKPKGLKNFTGATDKELYGG